MTLFKKFRLNSLFFRFAQDLVRLIFVIFLNHATFFCCLNLIKSEEEYQISNDNLA